MIEENLRAWREELNDKSPIHVLDWAARQFKGKAALASALGLEAQLITHFIAAEGLDIPVFTLDTGRLFPETYDLLQRTRDTYGIDIKVYFPDSAEVEEMVNDAGPNLFRNSYLDRKQCCFIRKVNPLHRALANYDGWITGLRRDQGVSRLHAQVVEWDEANQLYKVNPLWNWSGARVMEAIHRNRVPYNPLHDRGFPSIGCAPCTRAVQAGEDPRSGRWWWESEEQKECGLHVREGRLARTSAAATV